MAQSIREVFEDVAQHVVIDAALIQRIHAFERAFVNRNEDHVAFFGSPLMGVHPMRFRPTDRQAWFNDILDINELDLIDGIQSLKSIPVEWKRANDVMNHSCIWLVFAILKNDKLSPQLKEQGCVDTLLVLLYKFLGSLMAHNFVYPADEATMLAAYARLSRKFAIKVAGSWGALLRQRAEEQMKTTSIHRRAYTTMESDAGVINMISDMQSRLRELVKSYNQVFYAVRAQGERIATERSVIDMDGTTVLQDRTRQYSSYIRYAHSLMHDKNSFIRHDLIKVVCDAMHTMSPRFFVETLEWMCLNHRVKGVTEVDTLIDETLLFAFDLIERERDTINHRAGLMPLIVRLRALYMASRMSDTNLIKTKQLSEAVVEKAIASRNPSVVASVRTGVQLYIVLRTFAMSYYQK
jgi:hypothetical protein